MTPVANFVAALHLSFVLALLWILVFRLASDYRTDALRDKLFAVREKLFDYAVTGNISFDDPAYTKLRMLLNGLIRFAHRLTFSRLTLGCLFMAWRNEPCDKKVLTEWHQALAALPPEAQKELDAIHNSALVLVVEHLVKGSPIMLCMLAGFALLRFLKAFTRWTLVAFVNRRTIEAFTYHLPGLESLEAQTISADAEERQQHDEVVLAN
ncbi:MAG: hypothetical protein ABSH50_02705 [Bryobacteraceae bacterium]|jgi:hypothetical protein